MIYGLLFEDRVARYCVKYVHGHSDHYTLKILLKNKKDRKGRRTLLISIGQAIICYDNLGVDENIPHFVMK